MQFRKTKSLIDLFLAILLIVMLGWVVAAAPPASAQGPCGERVTVVYGDTLREIAERCKISVPAILDANPIITNPDLIYVGQVLQMPDSDEPSEPANAYIVKPGDRLAQIAARFDTTVSTLLALNPEITDPDLIFVGQRLNLPESQPEQDQKSPITATIVPTTGPPGTTVQLNASGLPPDTPVEIGLGRKDSEYDVVAQARTNPSGQVQAQVTIPSFADSNEAWVAVVTPVADRSIKAVSNVFTITEPLDSDTTVTVNVFLVALEEGELGCGDRLVPVERTVTAATQEPLKVAIQALLAIEEREQPQTGLYNALYQSDLQVAAIDLKDRKATLHLTGELQIGGVCDEPRFEAQLKQTALQFETVGAVEVLINGEPLERILSSK